MQQVRCPRCGQSYWQGTPHVCPPQPQPQPPQQLPPRYMDWRVNFLLNFGVFFAICWIIGMAVIVFGLLAWGAAFLALLQAVSRASGGP